MKAGCQPGFFYLPPSSVRRLCSCHAARASLARFTTIAMARRISSVLIGFAPSEDGAPPAYGLCRHGENSIQEKGKPARRRGMRAVGHDADSTGLGAWGRERPHHWPVRRAVACPCVSRRGGRVAGSSASRPPPHRILLRKKKARPAAGTGRAGLTYHAAKGCWDCHPSNAERMGRASESAPHSTSLSVSRKALLYSSDCLDLPEREVFSWQARI